MYNVQDGMKNKIKDREIERAVTQQNRRNQQHQESLQKFESIKIKKLLRETDIEDNIAQEQDKDIVKELTLLKKDIENNES